MRTSLLFARNLPRRLARQAKNPFVRSAPVVPRGASVSVLAGRSPMGNPHYQTAPQFRMPVRYAPPGGLGFAARTAQPPPGARLAAPMRGVPGEICWWTSPPDSKCCSYPGIALPFCVTYPDVE